METKVKVYAKAQNRIALGIIKAYYALNPNSTLNDLRIAFSDAINPDCGSKKIFMTEKEIMKHVSDGEEWYTTARGYFVGEDEWITMQNGERVGVVSMWSKPSLDRLIEQAKKYGIEAVESDEKRGTYRLEFQNEAKNTTQSNKPRNDEPMQTYMLRIEAENFYRIDVLELEKADDDIIEEGFENQEVWTNTVGSTECLYSRMSDLADSSLLDGMPDEIVESAAKLTNMVGDACDSDVNVSGYFPDAEEDFKIVVLNDEDKEIASLESSDIKSFSVEDGYNYDPDCIDDDTTRQMAEEFMRKNDLGSNRCDDFGLYKEGWTWVNIVRGEQDGYPIYELKTRGKFDPQKLLVKKVLVEEAFSGLKSIEVITDIIYDGECLEIYGNESGDAMYDDPTNLFIKRDSEEVYPSKVYDMTNYEKSE